MRFDLQLRSMIREQVEQLAQNMKSWEEKPRIDDVEKNHIRDNLVLFDHTTSRQDIVIAGVDGSGDFPAVSFVDSFVYVTVAHRTTYESNPVSGLRELGPSPEPVVHFTWLPEDQAVRRRALDDAFAYLAGMPIRDVVDGSDYRTFKSFESDRPNTVTALMDDLIRPHAADAGNIGIQLRSTAELGAALRLIQQDISPTYVLIDSTLSLPFVSRPDESLFYEHLKRLCCVQARKRGTAFLALSKSHGLPHIETIEELARDERELEQGQVAEHWYLRLPLPGLDQWEFSLISGRRLPPPGAVTYLFRLHRTTPVMRLDTDLTFWRSHVQGETAEQTQANECRIFEDLDYASHDQRCYGYPYPIKAAHDRASLTQSERVALRKQIIDAAVKAGMKRSLFRDASRATGHG